MRTRQYNSEFGTNRERLALPDTIYAMTNVTRSIFFDIAGISQSNVMGNELPPKRVAVNVPLAALKDDKFLAVELEIP